MAKPDSGMPAWSQLPEEQRWQIVTFLKSNDWPAAPAAYNASTAASV